MAELVVSLLGGLQARLPAGPALHLADRSACALLAYLSVPAGRMRDRDELARLLAGRARLAAAMEALRAALAGASLAGILTEAERVGLTAAAVDVDVAEFERAAASGTPEGRLRAATLYRGDFLLGFAADIGPFDAWAVTERERLRGLAAGALATLLDARLAAGDVEHAIDTARQLLTVDPLQEAAHRTLMRLYVRQGHAGTALRQYQALQRLVPTPSDESRALYHDILEGIFKGRRDERPQRSILVVEDDERTRALLEPLTGAGYDVVCAEDGADALLQLGRRRFDLVLSDIAMPNLNGVQLLDVMHKHAIVTPVLFVTGYSADEVRSLGLPLRPADYVQKPFRQAELLARVRAAVARADD